MQEKIILDTDIGTGIDDAIALTYLLANPKCELLGITTATGEPDKRAMIASSLCKIQNKNIPIYPGSANPLIIEQQQKQALQAASLSKWKHDINFPKAEAIEFLRKTIRKYPGEITLLTIGPLTNIGLLFAIDPEIPTMLKALIMMCGYFEHKAKGWNKLEWNAKGDCHAAHMVYTAEVPVHRSIGIDVTSQVTMKREEFRERFSLPVFDPLHDYIQHWYHYSEVVTFHDPLAAAVIFNDNICKFRKGNVSIDLNNAETAGLTQWTLQEQGKHEIAVSVDSSKFFEEYFSVFR